MQKYRHQLQYKKSSNHYKRLRFIRRVKIAALVLFLLAASVAIFIAIDSYLESQHSQEPSTATAPTTSNIAPTSNILRSSHFQFQAPKGWIEIATETSSDRFVYRNMQNSLIKEELQIYVNSSKDLPSANKNMAVEIAPSGTLLNPALSTNCAESFTENQGNREAVVVHEGIEMLCDPYDSIYSVVVGDIETGKTAMSLSRPDGTRAEYSMYYRNVTANPNAATLESILNTFETR